MTEKKEDSELKIKNCLCILLYALIIGIAMGFVGFGFESAVDIAAKLREGNGFLLYFLPLVGAAIMLMYKATEIDNGYGVENLLSRVRKDSGEVPFLLAPVVFVGASLSHLFGASVGREGAVLQIGGSVAAFIGKKIKLPYSSARIAVECGMAAGFSALFGTPLTASVFVLELLMKKPSLMETVSVFVSSISAFGIAYLLGNNGLRFTICGVPQISLKSVLLTLALAAVIALFAVVFVLAIENSKKLFKRLFKNAYLRAFAGGIIVIVATLLIGNRDYNGAGMNIIINALNGSAVPYAFLLKILMTALCIGVGFKGGEVVPTLFIGSTLGCTVASVVGLNSQFGAAVGMMGMFCAVTNSPIASMLFFLEVFGLNGLPFAVLCSVAVYALSGSHSLYQNKGALYGSVLKKCK